MIPLLILIPDLNYMTWLCHVYVAKKRFANIDLTFKVKTRDFSDFYHILVVIFVFICYNLIDADDTHWSQCPMIAITIGVTTFVIIAVQYI